MMGISLKLIKEIRDRKVMCGSNGSKENEVSGSITPCSNTATSDFVINEKLLEKL